MKCTRWHCRQMAFTFTEETTSTLQEKAFLHLCCKFCIPTVCYQPSINGHLGDINGHTAQQQCFTTISGPHNFLDEEGNETHGLQMHQEAPETLHWGCMLTDTVECCPQQRLMGKCYVFRKKRVVQSSPTHGPTAPVGRKPRRFLGWHELGISFLGLVIVFVAVSMVVAVARVEATVCTVSHN